MHYSRSDSISPIYYHFHSLVEVMEVIVVSISATLSHSLTNRSKESQLPRCEQLTKRPVWRGAEASDHQPVRNWVLLPGVRWETSMWSSRPTQAFRWLTAPANVLTAAYGRRGPEAPHQDTLGSRASKPRWDNTFWASWASKPWSNLLCSSRKLTH